MEDAVNSRQTEAKNFRPLKRENPSAKGNLGKKIGHMLRRYRHILALLAILLGTFFIGYYFNIFVIQGVSQGPACIIQSKPAHSLIEDLRPGETLSQQFEADGRDITGFAVDFATYRKANGGVLHFSLTDVETGAVLYEKRMATNELPDNQYYQLIFENAPVSCQKGQKLSINIYVEELDPDATLALYRTESDGYFQGVFFRNGEKEDAYDLAFQVYSGQNAYLKAVYWLFIAGCALFFMVVYFFLFMWKKKGTKELMAALVIFVFSCAYSLMLPPNSVPDEPNHYSTAYHYSNVLLGTDQYDQYSTGFGKAYVGKRVDDIRVIGLNPKPDINVYSTLKDNLFSRAENETVEPTSANILPAPQFLYAFSTLGITLGRILHVGPVPLYYLGRLFNIIAFCVAAYFAMRLMPFGKMTIFAVSVLPITLQQTGSVSYDVIINALAFLLIGLVMHLAYGEERIRTVDLVLTCVLSALLTMCKTGAYFPICLLVLIIPMKRFASRKMGWWFKGLSVGSVALGGILYLVITAVCFPSEGASPYLRWTETPSLPYSIGDLLTDPIHTIQLFVRTFAYQKDFYTETLLGHLSWFTIRMSPFLMIVFVIWALLTAVRPQTEGQGLKGGAKFWTGLMALGSMGIVMLGLTIGWTPNDYEIIQGVQGRYFLPFIPMALLMVRTPLFTVRKNIDGALIFCGLWLQLLTFLDFLRIILQGVYIP